MNLNEIVTVIALVLGPISAVLITVWVERRRKVSERRFQIVRMLLATRHIPADSQYCAAVNLIPAHFNDHTKTMEAWRKYIAVVSERPLNDKRSYAAQSAMIFQVMKSTGLELSESDIQTEAYMSQGFVDRDKVYTESLKALPELAEAMKAQVGYTRQLVERAIGVAENRKSDS